MIRPLATLKSWFVTGAKPTQDQFHDFMDSFIHQDNGVTVEDIEGLIALLNNKADVAALNALKSIVHPYRIVLDADGYYDLTAGMEAHHFKIKPSVDSPVKAGVTPGGEELIMAAEEALDANLWASFDTSVIADGADVRIYFTGIVAATEILIYRRTLTHSNV